jgi:hypothetical protein
MSLEPSATNEDDARRELVDEIVTWVGLDVGKADHHATVIDAAGEVRFDRAVGNDENAMSSCSMRPGTGRRS